MSNFLDWLLQQAQTKTGRDQTQYSIARTIAVSPSTVNRWRVGAMPDDKAMRAISRAYGVSMPAVLVHAGYMTEEEAGLVRVETPRRLSNAELLDEVRLRLVPDDTEVWAAERDAADAVGRLRGRLDGERDGGEVVGG